MHDRHRNQNALRLPDTELGCALVQEVRVVLRGWQANACQGELDRPVTLFGGSSSLAMRAPGFPQLGADFERGIERGEWALKHEAKGTSAEIAQFSFAHGQQIRSLEKDIPLHDGALTAE